MFHGPPVRIVPQDAPHPILDTSEEIIKSGVGGRIGLPLSDGRLFVHQIKSNFASLERFTCVSKLLARRRETLSVTTEYGDNVRELTKWLDE